MANPRDLIFYSDDKYEIRPAKSNAEFKDMWWNFMQELGWDRGYYDLDTYMNPSVGCGMILLIEKATGKACGHVAAVINPNSTGWVSMFIVDAAHRGAGMGRELFKAAVADFDRNGTKIRGLDGVTAQKATYERRQFVESPLGNIKIMMRPLAPELPMPTLTSGELIDIQKVPQKLLVEHELKYTGFERPRLWSDQLMFHREDVRGVAVVKRGIPNTVDDLLAWVVLRRCSKGGRIGPVYASDPQSAETVLVAAMRAATPQYIKSMPLPKEPISGLPESEILEQGTLAAEVWGGNPDAVQLFEKLGFKYVGVQYHRMWVDGHATPEQSEGGASQKGVFAVFDAAMG